MTKPPAPVLWLMGPTSAGKTTLARRLAETLRLNGGRPVLHYDGDEIRDFFGENLDFAPDSRLKVVSTLVTLARKASGAGVLTLVSALTAHADARELVRTALPGALVVYVKCPIDVCARRDAKGLYRRAAASEIDTLIGYNTEYLPPEAPDVEIDTSAADVESCVLRLQEFLRERGIE